MTASNKSPAEATRADGSALDKHSPHRKKTQSKLLSTQKRHKRVKTIPKPRKELSMNKIVASESRALFVEAPEQELHLRAGRQLQAQTTHHDQFQRGAEPQPKASKSRHIVLNTLNQTQSTILSMQSTRQLDASRHAFSTVAAGTHYENPFLSPISPRIIHVNQKRNDSFARSISKQAIGLHTSQSPIFASQRAQDTFSLAHDVNTGPSKKIFRAQNETMPPLPSTFGLQAASTEPRNALHLQLNAQQSRTRLPHIATVIHHSGLNMP